MRFAPAAPLLLLAACAFGGNPLTEEAALERANTDLVRGIYEAFDQGEIETVVAALAPDVRWTESAGSPYPGTFVGPDAVLTEIFARLGSEWAPFIVAPAEFVAQGDRVIAVGTYTGTYKETGRAFEAAFAHVWTVEDGAITRFQQIADTEMMQQALQGP